ncbi:MAG TPA: FHA domain-containing protein [Myxococcaceae bacterium]|nr:FHA domain-containing protein [Myxococcaceae bacterium]
MKIRLSVHEKSTSGAQAEPVDHTFEGPSITLGRDKGCDVVLPRQAVSRQHARISLDDELGFIEDLGSSFGTQVNGEPLPKGEKRLLKSGDLIVIAQFDITFSQERAIPEPGGEESTSYVSRAMVRGALRGVLSAEDPYFRFMNGDREGERIPISEAQELLVGRDPSAEIRLTDDLVSRRHAKLRRDLAGVHVEDLDSRNGIKVNKRKTRRRTLKDRDEVEIGAARLLFVDPNAIGEAPKVELPRPAPRPPAPRRPTEASGAREAPKEEPPKKAEPDAPAATAAPADTSAEPSPAPEPEPEATAQPAGDGAVAEAPDGDADQAAASDEEGVEDEGPEGAPDDEDAPGWGAPEGAEELADDGAAALRIGGVAIPGGSQTLIMAGLGLVGLFALIMMIALLVGA